MSVSIVDNFNSSHGSLVKRSLEENYTGQINEFNLQASRVTLNEIKDEVANAADANGEAINLSFGANEESNPDALLEIFGGMTLYQEIKNAWLDDQWFGVSAGNEGSNTINLLATTPYNFGVSAIDEDNNLEDYSQYHAQFTFAVADGEKDGAEGTSFSSPRVTGEMGSAKEEFDLTNPEVITAFQQSAERIEVNNGQIALKLDDIESEHSIERQEVIDATYRLFLDRRADEEGSTYWANDESSIDDILNLAIEKGDFNNQAVPLVEKVQSAYHVILNREADLGGLTWWTDTIISSMGNNIDSGNTNWEGDSWQDFVGYFFEFAKENTDETVYREDAVETFLAQEELKFEDMIVSENKDSVMFESLMM